MPDQILSRDVEVREIRLICQRPSRKRSVWSDGRFFVLRCVFCVFCFWRGLRTKSSPGRHSFAVSQSVSPGQTGGEQQHCAAPTASLTPTRFFSHRQHKKNSASTNAPSVCVCVWPSARPSPYVHALPFLRPRHSADRLPASSKGSSSEHT